MVLEFSQRVSFGFHGGYGYTNGVEMGKFKDIQSVLISSIVLTTGFCSNSRENDSLVIGVVAWGLGIHRVPTSPCFRGHFHMCPLLSLTTALRGSYHCFQITDGEIEMLRG